MPIVGVICGFDGTYQPFEKCIQCHESFSPDRNCHVPTVSIKSQRDNGKTRKGAGLSASVILNCPRAYAIEQTHDLYELVDNGYHKFRGTLIHALFEADPDPPPQVIMERRIAATINVNGEEVTITGKPDYIDPLHEVLIDFKSKHLLPKKRDDNHEAQLNIYRYLIHNGYFMDTKEKCDIKISRVGIHYVTFHTKKDMIWKKMLYPVWNQAKTERVLRERLEPLLEWRRAGELPQCSPYPHPQRWTCQCEKWENQLAERGITV